MTSMDDNNKNDNKEISNKPDFEDIAKKEDLFSETGSQILRQREQAIKKKNIEEIRIIEDIADKERKLDTLIDSIESITDEKELNKTLNRINNLTSRIESLQEKAVKKRREKEYVAENQFVQSVKTAVGQRKTVEDIAATKKDAINISSSFDLARQAPTIELEDRAKTARSLLRRTSEGAIQAAEQISEPGGLEKFQAKIKAQEQLKKEVGLNESAIAMQKKLGIDTGSQYLEAQKTIEKIEKSERLESVKEDARAGRAGTEEEIQESLNDISKQLVSTFERLSQAIKDSSDTLNKDSDERKDAIKATKDLAEEFSNLEKKYEEQSTALRIVRQQGGGQSALQEMGGTISDLGVITQGVARGYRYQTVTSEMEQTQNRIGYAQLAQQRFEDVYGSTQGDMAALRRVLGREYETQARAGADFRSKEKLSTGIEAVGKGVSTGGKILDTVASAETVYEGAKSGMAAAPLGPAAMKAAAIVGTGAQIGATVTPDVLETQRLGVDYFKDLSAGRTDIARQRQLRALQDSLSGISDFTMQKGYDVYKSMAYATRGFGGTSQVEEAAPKPRRGIPSIKIGESGVAGEILEVPEREQEQPQLKDTMAGALINQASSALDFFEDKSKSFEEMAETGQDMFSLQPKKQQFEAVPQKEEQKTSANVGRAADLLSRRESIAQRLFSKDAFKELASEASISAEQVPQLVSMMRSGLGVKAVEEGPKGEEGAEAVFQSIKRAGQLSRAGYLESPEQYMQARSALTSVGGGGENLEKILKVAVAEGLDSSKNIMQMVGAIQQLGQESAAYGISTTAATTEMLGTAQEDLLAMGVDKNLATSAAARGIQAAETFAQSSELDIFNVMEFSKLREQFPEAELFELEALQTASPQKLKQLRDLQKKAEGGGEGAEEAAKEAETLSLSMGLQGVLTSSQQTGEALKTTKEQVMRRTTGLGINRKLEEELASSINKEGVKFEDLSTEAQNFLNARAAKTGQASGAAIYGALREGKSLDSLSDVGTEKPMGRVSGDMENALQAGATAISKVMEDFTRQMDKIREKGFGGVGTVMKDISEQGLDISKFKEDVVTAADAMSSPINTFSENLTTFNKTTSSFTDKLDKLIDRMEDIVEEKTSLPSLPQKKGNFVQRDEN